MFAYKHSKFSGQPVNSVAETTGPTTASSPRLVVLNVRVANGLVLKALDTLHHEELDVYLQGEWRQTPVKAGHIVRVILCDVHNGFRRYHRWRANEINSGSITVDDLHNFLILHPDTLIKGTSVANSFRCLRKAVLEGRTPALIPSESAFSIAALYGSIIHDLLQNVLVLDSNVRDYSTEYELSQNGGVEVMSFYEVVEDVLANHSEDLLAAAINVTDAREVLHKVIPLIVDWYQKLMGCGNYLEAQGVNILLNKKTVNLVVSKVHDIEELVWSPVLGLKGKIDASVYLRIDGNDYGIGVLELKSGKSSSYAALTHNAQVSLYNLLLSDRKNDAINHGLLTYIRVQDAINAKTQKQGTVLEKDQTHPLPGNNANNTGSDDNNRIVFPPHSETVSLLVQRNKLADYLRIDADVEDFPPILECQQTVCNMCFMADSCMIQYRLLEGGTEETVENGPGKEFFQRRAGTLTERHGSYYKFWKEVLADEEEISCREGRDLWSMSGSQREKLGKCLSDLVLVASESTDMRSPHELIPPGVRIEVEFRRRELGTKAEETRGLDTSKITVGEYVMVSAEGMCGKDGKIEQFAESISTWQCALTSGFVSSVSKKIVRVTVDRSLTAWSRHQGVEQEKVVWRLDAEEMLSSHNVSKRSLDALFYNEETSEGAQRLRRLIVEGYPPAWPKDMSPSVQRSVLETLSSKGVQLNDEQLNAVLMSMRLRDYQLILGMPGTGKTSTLTAIIIAHASQGRSVLICSHTNKAVDNVLGRLLKVGFDDFVRLGKNEKVVDVHVRSFLASNVMKGTTLPRQSSEEVVLNKRVVGTTCLGINHWLLEKKKKFDLVVVDEASQVLQPICIGPLHFASGPFILVGDHYQLPPLHRGGVGQGRRLTRRADTQDHNDSHGLEQFKSDESLFRRLCERHPTTIFRLRKQYRMAQQIMDLSNEMVYGGNLECGSAEVAQQRLQMDPESQSQYNAKDEWINFVTDANRRVIFLDTGLQSESSQDNVLRNDGCSVKEADIVRQCVLELTASGVKPTDITVLSPFRAQVELIRRNSSLDVEACEVATADQFQGRDNNCIIVSFARSGDSGVGPLLRDWRRMNVILTRAKRKLILVGCALTLSRGSYFLKHMVEYLGDQKAVVIVK